MICIRKRYWAILLVSLIGMILFNSRHGWQENLPYSITAAADSKLADTLKSHVQVLSQQIGNRSMQDYSQLKETAQYINDQFTGMGYEVSLQSYEVNGKPASNIIALKRGAIPSAGTIVIGAHYDTYGNPGADDNASGVAGLLETARLLANQQTNKNIEFVAFVNEELPYFHTDNMGSRIYTKIAREQGKTIDAAIILEMIGYYSDEADSQRYPRGLGILYPNRGNFVAVISNLKSHILATDAVDTLRNNMLVPVEAMEIGFFSGADFSDHWSFWQENYPSIMVTDTAFYRNNNYHKQTDTYETLNYIIMSRLVKGLAATVVKIAES